MTSPQLPVNGTPEDDILVGNKYIDTLLGDDGADVLVGFLERDILLGGAGDDLIIGGGAQLPLKGVMTEISEEDPSGLAYFDRPNPLTFADTLIGGDGADTLVGGSWDDSENADGILKESELDLGDLTFQESWGFNNVIWGGAGDDLVYGANGFDTLGGGAGDDILRGYDAPDVIYGGAGNDTLLGGAGDAELFHREAGGGYTATEELYGGPGNDQLSGEAGDDKLYGGTGNDMLIGGQGHDTMTGGAGADVFDYSQGMDVITDFNVEEDILSIELGLSPTQLKEQASEQTIDGKSGLLIVIGDDDGVFLEGLTLADFDQINIAI